MGFEMRLGREVRSPWPGLMSVEFAMFDACCRGWLMRVSGGREVERKEENLQWEISKLKSLFEALERERELIKYLVSNAEAWALMERRESSCVRA